MIFIYKPLEDQLLKLAPGSIMYPGNDEDDYEIDLQLAVHNFGKSFGKTYKLIEGRPNACGLNSYKEFEINPEFYDDVCTGFALSEKDGQLIWYTHSWLVDKKGRVIETTVPRIMYFGYMDGENKAQ